MTAVTPMGWDRRHSQSAAATSSGPSPRAPRSANGVAAGAPAASPKAPRTSPSSGTVSGTGGLATRPLAASPLPPRLTSPKVPRPGVAAAPAPKSSPQTPRNASIPPPPMFSPLPNTWLNDKLSGPKAHGSLLLYNRGLPGSASEGDNREFREVREGASPKVSLVRHDGAGGEVLVRAYSFQGVPGGGASVAEGHHAENTQNTGCAQHAQTAADDHCGEDGGTLVIANTLRRNYQLGNRSDSAIRYRNGYLAHVAVTGEDLAERIGLPSRAPAFAAYVAASRKLQLLTLDELTRQLQESAIWPSKFESLKQRLQSRGVASGGHEASKKLPRLPAEGGGNSGSPTSVLDRSCHKLTRLQPHLIQFYRFCRQMLLDLLLLTALEATDTTDTRYTSSQVLPFNGFALPWAAEFVPTSSSLGAMVTIDRASGVSKASGDCNGGAALRRQQLAARWLELCAVAAGAGKDFAPGERAQAQAQAKREATAGLKGAWDAEKNDALFEVLSRMLLALRMDEILANVVTGTVDEEEEAAANAGASGKRAEDELVKRWRRRASDGTGTRGALVLAVKLSGTDASRWVLRMAGGADAHVRRVAAGVIDRILWDVETGRVQNELEKECARLDSNPRPGGISGPRSLPEISSILSLPDPLSSCLPRSPLSLSSSESDSSGSDGEDQGKGGRVGGKKPSSIPVSSSDVLISRVAGALIASLGAAAALPVGTNATTGARGGSNASGPEITSGGGLSPESRSLSLPTGVDPKQLLPTSSSTSSPESSTSAGSTASSGSNAAHAQGGSTAEGEDGGRSGSNSSRASSTESTAASKPKDGTGSARKSVEGGFGVGSTVLGLTSPRAPAVISAQVQQQQRGAGDANKAVPASSRLYSSVPCSPAHHAGGVVGGGSRGAARGARSGRGVLDAEAAAARLQAIAAAAAEAGSDSRSERGRSAAPESPRFGASRYPAAPGSVVSVSSAYSAFTVPPTAMSLNGDLERTLGSSGGLLNLDRRGSSASVTGVPIANSGYHNYNNGYTPSGAAYGYSGSGRFGGEGGGGGAGGGGRGASAAAAAAVAASRMMSNSVPSSPLHPPNSPVHYASTPVHYSNSSYSHNGMHSTAYSTVHQVTAPHLAQFPSSPNRCTSSPRYVINPSTPRSSTTGLYSSSPRHPGASSSASLYSPSPSHRYCPSPSPHYSHSPVHHVSSYTSASPSHPATLNPPYYTPSPTHYSGGGGYQSPSPSYHSYPSPAPQTLPPVVEPAALGSAIASAGGRASRETATRAGKAGGEKGAKRGGVKSTLRQKAFFGAGVVWSVEEGGLEGAGGERESGDSDESDSREGDYDEGSSSEEDKDDNTLGFSRKYNTSASSSASACASPYTSGNHSAPSATPLNQRPYAPSPAHSALSRPSPSRSTFSSSPAHASSTNSPARAAFSSSPARGAFPSTSIARSASSGTAPPAASAAVALRSVMKGSITNPHSRGTVLRRSASESGSSRGDGVGDSGEMAIGNKSGGGEGGGAMIRASSSSSSNASTGSSGGDGVRGGRRRSSKVTFAKCGEIEEEEAVKEAEVEGVKMEGSAPVAVDAATAAAPTVDAAVDSDVSASADSDAATSVPSASPPSSVSPPASLSPPAPVSPPAAASISSDDQTENSGSGSSTTLPSVSPPSPLSVAGSFTSFLHARNNRPATPSDCASEKSCAKQAPPLVVKARETQAMGGVKLEGLEGKSGAGEKKRAFWRWRPWKSSK